MAQLAPVEGRAVSLLLHEKQMICLILNIHIMYSTILSNTLYPEPFILTSQCHHSKFVHVK